MGFQRPSARELLKHKFVRMAKKTSYLTELIDRLDRWKAEGGARQEQEELAREDDQYVLHIPQLQLLAYFTL